MMNWILISLLLLICCTMASADSFFTVTSSGQPASISMTICLNGKGPLSCQNYTSSALNVNIKTTVPGHTYPYAGIKINTPGYTLAGCSMISNGYCLFSVSNTTSAIISAMPVACQSTPDLIIFSPTAIQVNNPTGNISNASQQFTVNMTICNSQGKPLVPSKNNPVHLNVYGAPNGVISPTSLTTNTNVATFTYSGQTFPNNIIINAYIQDTTNNGYALGQTQVLQKNPLLCSYSPTYFEIPLSSTLPNTISVEADVGYSTSSPITTLRTYTMDTGSLGVILPVAELPKTPNVIGPGPAGITYYNSSGNTYTGNYYFAPVRIKTSTGTVMTQPIMVLAINKAFCSGPRTARCNANPPSTNFHYLGVGFNRPGSASPDSTLQNLINSPASNAFLHITDANNGVDVTPGYSLYPSATLPSSGLRLGIDPATAASHQLFKLTADTSVPGDFLTEYGCFGFTTTTPAVQFCGTLLLDVGIDEMFLNLPRSLWPSGTYDSNRKVPETFPPIGMSITAGTANQMFYTFDAVQSCPSSTGPNAVAPCYAQWEDSASTGLTSVNTGRRALYQYHYFYQGQCGVVGFEQY